MPKNFTKYNQKIALFFLLAYFSFVIIGIFHYHNFDLNTANKFNTETQSTYTDINSDFFGVCSLHQFSQTINNSYCSSSDINLSLAEINTKIDKNVSPDISLEIFSRKSPRAPPIFS